MITENKIKEIYFERLIIENEEFPFTADQKFVQLTMNPIIIEWNNGIIEIISLTNEKIDYSLQTTFFEKNNLISLNATFGKSNNEVFKQIIDCPLTKSYFLHLIDNNEIEIESYPNDKFLTLNDNLIGKKFIFKNGIELFFYCSEPEMVGENRFKVYRNNDIACIIIDDKQSIQATSIETFPREYILRKKNINL